jgi:hypothetical protein
MKNETQTLKRDDATVDVGANDVDYKKVLGADDGSLVDSAVEAIKGVAGKVANKLDPLTDQYAGLFKTGLRTPVMRKPSDYGMAFEETWFPSMAISAASRSTSLPELKALHDAGYNILTYDLRNCGRSGEGQRRHQRPGSAGVPRRGGIGAARASASGSSANCAPACSAAAWVGTGRSSRWPNGPTSSSTSRRWSC